MRQSSDAPSLTELFDDIRNLALGAWRFRWQAVLLAWLVCVVSWLFVLTIPDVYQASARLHIDSQSSLRPLLKGLAVNSDLMSDVNVMVKSIVSRPNLETIAARSGMYTGDSESELEALVNRLTQTVEIGLSRDQILEIRFQQSDRNTALAVVSIVYDMFVEGLRGTNRSDTASAQEFIEEKIAEYEVLLAKAETRLAEFKKRNVGQMPRERGGYFARMQGEMSKLENLQFKLRLATQRRDSLERQLAGEVPVFGLLSPGTGRSATSPQIAQLEAELTNLRLRFTDEHPDVVRLKALIETLRAELIEQQSQSTAPAATPLDANPVYQQMKIQLNQAELELERLTLEQADQAKLVRQLKQKIDTIPEIEAELTRLNRDYDVNKAQYDALLQRLETARLSEDAEESSSKIKFRLIDPPAVGSTPVGPNRELLLSVGLIFGLAAGAALAVLRGFLHPVFFSAQKLERRYAIPVLGSIVRYRSARDNAISRLNMGGFAACLIVLIIGYGVLLANVQTGAEYVAAWTRVIG